MSCDSYRWYHIPTPAHTSPQPPTPFHAGKPLTMAEADDRLFGLVLMNDWSARDIQKVGLA